MTRPDPAWLRDERAAHIADEMTVLPATATTLPTFPRRRQQPEQALQTQVVKFLRAALAGNSWFGSVPLGGGGASRGRTLKRTGAVAGTPDMLLVNDGRAIWIELKAPKGVVSDAQLYAHQQLRQAGSLVFVCRSLDEVIEAMRSAGVPLRIGERFL